MPFNEAVPFGDNASAYDGDTIYQGGQGFRHLKKVIKKL